METIINPTYPRAESEFFFFLFLTHMEEFKTSDPKIYYMDLVIYDDQIMIN